MNGIAVLGLEEARHAYPTALMVGGVGNPATRERLLAKAGAVGFDFCTLIHPGIQLSDSVTIGSGTVICPGAILTTNITLGRHVQINLNCTVGHDARLDDFVTLAPGVHVSGWVHVERGAYLGTGATVVNGTPMLPGDRRARHRRCRCVRAEAGVPRSHRLGGASEAAASWRRSERMTRS